MKNALIITTRAFSSDFKSLYEQMAFLKEEYDNIYLVHAYTTDRMRKFVEETARIKITADFSISSHVDDVGKKHIYKNWEEYYDNVDISFLKDIHIDDVWMFGAPLSEGGHLKRGALGLSKNFRKNSYMKFLSVAKYYIISYIALKIANEKKAFYREICYDPGEASVNEITEQKIMPTQGFEVYHGYDIAIYGMKKHSSYQYGLKAVGKTFPFASKDYDITFGYSFMTDERKKDHELMQKVYSDIQGKVNGNLLYRSKKDDHDSLVGKDEYMCLITESRYTFIIPAYMKGAFSCLRFIESIFYDCLPLVFDHCVYEEFFDSYNIDKSIYDEIIVNQDNVLDKLTNMTEQRRVEIIEYMKEKLF